MNIKRTPTILILLVAGIVAAGGVFASGGKDSGTIVTYEAPARTETPASYTPSASGLEALEALQNQFRVVAEQVLPVVVEINVVDVIERRVVDPFSNFFGNRSDDGSTTQQYRQPGLGSGVLVGRSEDTVYVLTNNHVVETADEIQVVLYDGREYEGSIIGTDARQDLALVSFKSSEDIPIAVLGDSDSLNVGDWVFAVGNPLGFESTVTQGIVSAVGRRPANAQNFTDYIQTDAAINQGNSGGALVNLYGEVVGINSWIASNSGGSIGLGFSIPINTAKEAIRDFIESGEVAYGWLGITVGLINDDVKAELGYEGLDGGFVYNVVVDSPADLAGILPGDYITRVGETVVSNQNDVTVTVGSLSPGETAPFEVHRLGQTLTVDVTIGKRNEAMLESGDYASWPGLSVVTLTDEMRDRGNVPDDAGSVVVATIDEDSAAETAGIRGGDIISAIDGSEISGIRDFYSALNDDSNGRVEFTIWRRGSEISIGVSLR